MASTSNFPPLALTALVCTFLLLLTIAPRPALSSLSDKHAVPSHHEILSRAHTIVHHAANANAKANISSGLGLEDLKSRWPHLHSPTMFEKALWSAIEKLSGGGEEGAKLLMERLLAAAPNVSVRCVEDFGTVLTALRSGDPNALKMIDAMGKPSPNVQGYNLNWPGALKECQEAFFLNTLSSTPQKLFGGEYCTAHILISKAGLLPFEVSSGICVPDSCSSMDIDILLNAVFSILQIHLPQYAYALCQDPNGLKLDNLAIAGLVVVGVFLALMVVGTLVDLLYRYAPQWRRVNRMDPATNNIDNFYTADSSHLHFNSSSHMDNVLLLGQQPTELCEPGLFSKALIAFSVYTNGAKLLNTDHTAGTLGCVHGIRFLSMSWVVLGHSFLFPIYVASNFAGYFTEVLKRWTFQAIINATVSVDTFFVLSGLLVSYLGLKEMKKTGGRINWFKFYFHRFWRLTPPYMLIIFVYMSLGAYWGSGPMWVTSNSDRDNCRTYWWHNLLYINNFFPSTESCLGQSWYLANDMQFYILSPLIFVAFYFSPIYGTVSSLVFLLATTIPPAAITMTETLNTLNLGQQGGNGSSNSYFEDYYVKPYNRMGPYIVGMVTGFLLYRTNCKARINKVVNLVCWAVATAVALAVLYGLYETYQGHPLTRPVQALYNAVARTAWGGSVAWVVFACVTGNGGFVNAILSWKVFVPLSRLTYVIYLIHIMVLTTYGLSRDTTFYYSDANVIALFLALLVVCYMISAVVSLAFEAPMMALEKLVLNHRSQHHPTLEHQANQDLGKAN